MCKSILTVNFHLQEGNGIIRMSQDDSSIGALWRESASTQTRQPGADWQNTHRIYCNVYFWRWSTFVLLILDTYDIIVVNYYYYLKGNDCHLSTHSYLSGAWRFTAVLEPICLISQWLAGCSGRKTWWINRAAGWINEPLHTAAASHQAPSQLS